MITKQESRQREALIDNAAKQYKMDLLRMDPMLDEFARKLNAEPTYEERRFVKYMWSVFAKLGARLPEAT